MDDNFSPFKSLSFQATSQSTNTVSFIAPIGFLSRFQWFSIGLALPTLSPSQVPLLPGIPLPLPRKHISGPPLSELMPPHGTPCLSMPPPFFRFRIYISLALFLFVRDPSRPPLLFQTGSLQTAFFCVYNTPPLFKAFLSVCIFRPPPQFLSFFPPLGLVDWLGGSRYHFTWFFDQEGCHDS